MNIAVLGAGYVGLNACIALKKKGHVLTATTRSEQRLEELYRVADKSIILKDKDLDALTPLILDHELLLITIGADHSDSYESAYLENALAIRQIAEENQCSRKLIYTSSTSVYGDHEGLWVDETSELKTTTDQGKILIETERVFQSLHHLGWNVCILRLSEIYGPKRELSSRLKHFEGRFLPGNGSNYSNMIHVEDVVHAIDYSINHQLNGVYNLADDDHPTRKELYEAVVKKFALPSINWDPNYSGYRKGNKRISNHKIKSAGFSFSYPHRILN